MTSGTACGRGHQSVGVVLTRLSGEDEPPDHSYQRWCASCLRCRRRQGRRLGILGEVADETMVAGAASFASCPSSEGRNAGEPGYLEPARSEAVEPVEDFASLVQGFLNCHANG